MLNDLSGWLARDGAKICKEEPGYDKMPEALSRVKGDWAACTIISVRAEEGTNSPLAVAIRPPRWSITWGGMRPTSRGLWQNPAWSDNGDWAKGGHLVGGCLSMEDVTDVRIHETSLQIEGKSKIPPMWHQWEHQCWIPSWRLTHSCILVWIGKCR